MVTKKTTTSKVKAVKRRVTKKRSATPKDDTPRVKAAKEILDIHNSMEVRAVKLSTILKGMYKDRYTGNYRYSGRGYNYTAPGNL